MKAVKGKYFFGGIHPRGKTYATASLPVEVMPAPDVVYISTAQSLGKPATPVVTAGQTVKEGELIARANGAISSDVFASVAGTVTEISEKTGANGDKETFIVIKCEGGGDKLFRFPPLSSPTAEEIRARIKDCGIVGLGGAGFPTAVKVAPKTPVDTLIINGSECEPNLTCDNRLMIENTDEIARGARYVAKALGVENIAIGIKPNKPEAIAAFEKYDDIKVVVLSRKYPIGGERQISYAVTGRKIPQGKIPAEYGITVQNVATCFAVCEAVEQGKPLYERVITVAGKSIREGKNLKVRVGTPIKDIVEYCGGEASAPKKVVLGGVMTGTALASYDAYTHKTTAGVLVMSEKEMCADEPTPCLNCGKCADVCPMNLMPMNTAFYSAAGDFEAAQKYGNAQSCIECGCCEYVCPARRPLIQAIRKTKAALKNKKGESKNG